MRSTASIQVSVTFKREIKRDRKKRTLFKGLP